MKGNGIGPLVSQFVHERNALRKAEQQEEKPAKNAKTEIKPHPHADKLEFSESALARFEALKAKLAGRTPEEDTIAAPGDETEPVEPLPVADPIEAPDPATDESSISPFPVTFSIR